jgi:ribosome biogenesis GTPase
MEVPVIKPTNAAPDGPEGFVCAHCGQPVAPDAAGTAHRNHCPRCLWSRHLDLRPGDRRSACRGMMEPVAVWLRHGGEWALIHRCNECGVLRSNRIAGDDNELSLIWLAVRPIAQPPFPLDTLPGGDALRPTS